MADTSQQMETFEQLYEHVLLVKVRRAAAAVSERNLHQMLGRWLLLMG